MSISESVLRRIISEEARRIMEGHDDLPGPRFGPGSVRFPGPEALGRFEPPEGEWEPDPFDDPTEDVDVPGESEDEPDEDDPNYFGDDPENDPHYFRDDDLDEGKKKHKASAGTLAAFKKGAKDKKGGERKKRHAGFDAAKKSAEKWADDPAAVAQAATIKATGKPVVAKGEKRKSKNESRELQIEIIRG